MCVCVSCVCACGCVCVWFGDDTVGAPSVLHLSCVLIGGERELERGDVIVHVDDLHTHEPSHMHVNCVCMCGSCE